MKTVGRILKYTALTLIFSIIAFLLVRILIAEYYPAAMKELTPTETLRAAYEANPNLEMRRQKLAISYDNAEFALFMADHQYYCPEAGELQIALRYNESTLAEVKADFGLSEEPAPSPELFDFTLYDDNGNRYPLALQISGHKYMYHYYKLGFTGVDFSEKTNWIRVDIYYKDAINYDEEPYACILLYNKELAKDDTVYTLREGDLAR